MREESDKAFLIHHATDRGGFDKCRPACDYKLDPRFGLGALVRNFWNFPEAASSKDCQGTVSADDKRLIAECLQGRTSAFGDLIGRYQDRLYNTVYRLLDNAEDARDVVQETFLSAYQSLGSFKGDSLFFTWLYRIAFNTAISFKRKQRVTLRLHAGPDGTGVEPLDLSEGSQPGYALEKAEEERRIQRALNRLSPEHRIVLVMKDIEGQKYDVIAEVLQVPIGTVRSRIHRARLELREWLLQEERQK
jgi:RNA polymerase sigma-70 factor (ECF subfamily)